jgi:hydrogenase maturation protease
MMSSPHQFRIAVLGLGNLMRTDDALGMLALDRLKADARFPETAKVIEGGTLGLDLLEDLRDISHVLALDAVDIGAEPGVLSRFEGQELIGLPISKSVHLLGFSDLINVLQLMDASPAEVVLLGVQPESTDWGTALTPRVEAAQTELIEAVIAQINDWTEQGSLLNPSLAEVVL